MPSHTKRKASAKRSKRPAASPKDYQIVVRWSAKDGVYLAEAPALQGCRTHGDTPEEALRNGLEAVTLWLEEAIEHGESIPLPAARHSGKLTVRLPASLHERIAFNAERDHVSINQW